MIPEPRPSPPEPADASPLRYPRFRRSRAQREARQHIPFRQVVPSAITTSSLCAGLASIHFALQGDFDRALFAIAFSAVLDTFDGLAARLLKAQTSFGAVLDSLADLVCFGVAPALLLHQWMGKAAGVDPAFTLGSLLVFVLCSALRLARFTAAPSKPPANPALSRFFTGMPTPAAAACALVPPMLDQSKLFTATLPTWVVVLNTFFIAWLMISRVPMYALKHVHVKRRHVPVLLVVLAMVVVGLVRDTWLTLSAVAVIYLFTVPLSVLAHRRAKERWAGLMSGPESPVAAVMGPSPVKGA
jgi:CDP-diacylglycerol--serine O-phosphatidyltransferase